MPAQPDQVISAEPVRFRLLGPVRASGAELGGATARAVLAVLLSRGNAGASTEEIITAVWGDPGGATRDSVYHYLSALRKALVPAGVVLETRQPRYRLVVAADAVDWHRFRRLTGAARAGAAGQPERAAELFREALRLWTGPPLADVGGRLAPLRREMADQRQAAVEALAGIEARLGRPDETLVLLQEGLPAGPVREQAAVLMIDALTALGRREDAGRVYRQTRGRLASEQGLAPGPQLEAAHRRSLDGTAASAPMAAAPVNSALANSVPVNSAPMNNAPVNSAPISGLPRADLHFTGRAAELQALTQALAPAAVPGLCAIYGMAGLGKTALAVSAARALAGTFPDGVIFLDLHGHTGQRAVLTPAEVLDRLLRRMRLDGSMIPADFDEQVALYHDLLSQRRLLLIFDSVGEAAQIRPVLPTAAGCAAIVTSRRRLATLDDATVLPLGHLPVADSVALLRSVVGADRLRGEPHAGELLAQIADLCGRLPLALRIAAGRYRVRHHQPLADLVEKLSGAGNRLTELDDDERSVTASFRTSLHDLPASLARLFALLSVDPGADFDAWAAAALADLPVPGAATQLSRLADRHLIAEHAAGRYRFHDLIGTFAQQYAQEAVPAADRARALQRLADYFLRTAEAADLLIAPFQYRVPLGPPSQAVACPAFGDYGAALSWLTAEQGNLADTCTAAGAAGLDTVCWQLAYTMRGYFYLTKSLRPWRVTHEAALAAARRSGDVKAEAMIVNNLGLAHLEAGSGDLAAGCYRQARDMFTGVGDRHGANTARANLVWLLFSEQRLTEFLTEMEPVLSFYRETGAERNAAITLRGMGLAEGQLGRTAESVARLHQALEVFTRLELRLDTAMTWNALGEAYQHSGETQPAARAFAAALDTSGQCGSDYELARAHHRLGQLAAGAGERESARRHWAAAVDGYQRVGAVQAAEVQAALAALAGSS